jgi:hypothetical protein
MIIRFAIALFPVLAWAQAGPAALTPGAPPEVDQALRARVSQFFQYHVDGDFRRAYDLVAENTKDEYFNSAKTHLKKFELAGIKYNDDFTKAEVSTAVSMIWNIRIQENLSVVPMITTWKIEDGKWVWYHDIKTGAGLTPMGPSTIITGMNDKNSKVPIPDHIDDAAVANAAQKIVKQVTVDKQGVSLASGKDQVRVHNGTPGYVQLTLAALPDLPGFSATFDTKQLGPNQDAVLRLEYKPVDKEPHSSFPVRIVTEPFNQVFTVLVNLGNPSADQ